MIAALRDAVPYIRLYKGRIFVIKVDSAVFDDSAAGRAIIEQVAVLRCLGIRVVIVQGGGSVQAQVLTICRELGIDAVGEIVSTDQAILRRELDADLMPVVGPWTPGHGDTVRMHDAEMTAASISAALAAEKLIFCTDTPGILERQGDPSSLVSYTDLRGLRRLAESGCLDSGALPEPAAIEAAIKGGVRRVHVISCHGHDSLLAEVFTNEGTGTMIVADINALTPAEQRLAAAVA